MKNSIAEMDILKLTALRINNEIHVPSSKRREVRLKNVRFTESSY